MFLEGYVNTKQRFAAFDRNLKIFRNNKMSTDFCLNNRMVNAIQIGANCARGLSLLPQDLLTKEAILLAKSRLS